MSLAARGKARRAYCPGGVVAQQVRVLLHGAAAAGGVDDDCVELLKFKLGDHAFGEGCGLRVEPGMHHQRAAAALALRDDDV